MKTLTLFALLCCAACGGAADAVCQDLGDCQNLSAEQIAACQRAMKSLATEAASSTCATGYSAYLDCAASNYQCKGSTPEFAGCESARTTLDACLGRGRASNACGQLETRLAACPGGGALQSSPLTTPPAPCGAAEECAAQCFLDHLSDVCRPTSSGLVHFKDCAQSCPR